MYIRSFFTLLFLATIVSSCQPKAEKRTKIRATQTTKKVIIDTTKLTKALEFCTTQQMNADFALLVNLSQHSGNYRMFAVNLKTRDTLLKGLVTHGHCQEYKGRMASFSNAIGSNCSSQGKYQVGAKYSGMFGTAYKLHGLDSSNSNAFNRFVVLHSHSCVPNKEQEDDICASEGCPTVSPAFLQKLEPFLDNSQKPILLWVYKD